LIREPLIPVPETQSAFHPRAGNAFRRKCRDCVYDDAANVIETHELKDDFVEGNDFDF
jgi:hypothetical protein